MANGSGENLQQGAPAPLDLVGHLNGINGALASMTQQPANNELFGAIAVAALAPISAPISMFAHGIAAVMGVSANNRSAGSNNSPSSNTKKTPEAVQIPMGNPLLRQPRARGLFAERRTLTSAFKSANAKRAEQKAAALKKELDNTLLTMKDDTKDPNRVQADIVKSSTVRERAAKSQFVNSAPKVQAPKSHAHVHM